MSRNEKEALRLFRILHGKGDAGSPTEFYCQNPALHEGWLRLAAHVEKRTKKAKSKS